MLSTYSLMTRGLFIMDKYIIVNLNMFAKESKVFVADKKNLNLIETYSIEELPDVITALAHKNDIYTVKIAGNSKFAQLIEYGIETNEMTKYNERKIKVEVI